MKVLWAYLRRVCPDDRTIRTRFGYTIHLTGDEDDVVTVLSVIGGRSYGLIPRGGVVIDVGAHLGSFALYAASNHAGHVYCYEPDPTLYENLLKNIGSNQLEGKIKPRRAAILGTSTGQVTFYREGNASGHVDRRPDDCESIKVECLTLSDIIANEEIDQVDLLKLDCEGSEYGIVFETAPEIWNRIKRVRLEYHKGQDDQLVRRLQSLGYQVTRNRKVDSNVGMLWFEKYSMA